MSGTSAESPNTSSPSKDGKLVLHSVRAAAVRSIQTELELLFKCGSKQELGRRLVVIMTVLRQLQANMYSPDARQLAYIQARKRCTAAGIDISLFEEMLEAIKLLGRNQREADPISGLF